MAFLHRTRIQIVGRSPGDPPNSRTIHLFDVPAGTAQRLVQLVSENSRFAGANEMACDALGCVATTESTFNTGAVAIIAVVIAVVIGSVVAVVVVVIRKKRAAAAVVYAGLQDEDEDATELSENNTL